MDIALIIGSVWLIGILSGYLSDRALTAREKRYQQLTLTVAPALKSSVVSECRFVYGSVTMGINPITAFLGRLRCLIGGNIPGYERALRRARREALLRMKQAFPSANYFVGVRVEGTMLNGRNGRFRGLPRLEIIAYGTGVRTKLRKQSSQI